MKTSICIFFFALACSTGKQAEQTHTKTEPSTKSVAKTDGAEKTSKQDKNTEETSKKAKPFEPLAGKSITDICSSNSLALIKWPYDKLNSDFKSLCCGEGGLPEDHEYCMLDWPSSDVLSCSAYDEMRNEIYARYGRAFKGKRWQKTFGSTAWYKVRADYSDQWLSKTAMSNVSQLSKMKKNKVACVD